MSKMTEPSWTAHVARGTTWRRFGFMLVLAPILACAGFLVAFTALFQFFSVLASGETNPQLTGFGRELSRFATSIMDFLTYNTERRPFPFGPWPQETGRRTSQPASAAATKKAPGRRKRRAVPARKRSPRRRPGDAGREEGATRPSEPEEDDDGGASA